MSCIKHQQCQGEKDQHFINKVGTWPLIENLLCYIDSIL